MKVSRSLGFGIILIPIIWVLSINVNGERIANLVALFKRDSTKTIASVPITQPPSLLGAWSSIIKEFRQSLHSDSPPSSANELVSFYTPVIILASIVFLGAFILAFASFSMYINSCCCKNRLRRKYERMKPPSTAKAICAKFLFGFPPLIILFMISIHIMASNHLTDTISVLEVSTNNLVGDTFAIIIDAAPAIVSLLDSIALNVNSSILTAASSVDFAIFTSTVNPPMNRMIEAMRQTENDKRLILNNSAIITVQQSYLDSNTSLLSTQISALNSNVTYLMGTLRNSTTNQYYRVSTPINPSTIPDRATAMITAAEQAPNTTSIFSSLESSPNLNTAANDAEIALADSVSNAENSIEQSTSGN